MPTSGIIAVMIATVTGSVCCSATATSTAPTPITTKPTAIPLPQGARRTVGDAFPHRPGEHQHDPRQTDPQRRQR